MILIILLYKDVGNLILPTAKRILTSLLKSGRVAHVIHRKHAGQFYNINFAVLSRYLYNCTLYIINVLYMYTVHVYTLYMYTLYMYMDNVKYQGSIYWGAGREKLLPQTL